MPNVMSWCPKCHKVSIKPLTVYRGKIMCPNCVIRAREEERQKGLKPLTNKHGR